MGQAAEYLGLSATTGAFAAGVLLANNRYRAQIKADVRPFEGILLGIFFLTAGASLDPAVIFNDLPTLLIGIFVFIFIKAAVLYLAAPTLGKTRAQAARVAITLAGGGEFSLVLFNVANDLGVLPDQLAKLLSASVIISMSLTPLLGELADAAGDYLESRDDNVLSEKGEETFIREEAMELFDKIDSDGSGTLDFDELRAALVEQGLSYVSIAEIFLSFDTEEDGVICREEWNAGLNKGLLANALAVGSSEVSSTKGRVLSTKIAEDAIVICGFTEFGREMYGVLEGTGVSRNGGLVAFDLNPSRVAAGLLSGANVVYGDGASPDLLRAAGVKKPRGVVVAFRSEAVRLEATARLREGLPEGTPIYARVVSGQSVGRDELMEAGATDVVSERTEAAIRFGALLGAFEKGLDPEELRRRKIEGSAAMLNEQAIPGLPEARLDDLAEEFGCERSDLIDLYQIFQTLPDEIGDQFHSVKELQDVFLRTAGEGPIDDDTLARWVELADFDRGGGGVLSFTDFARVYFSSKDVKAADPQ